jgi:hypothetical protein
MYWLSFEWTVRLKLLHPSADSVRRTTQSMTVIVSSCYFLLLRVENKDISRLYLRRVENKWQEASEKIAVTVTEESRLNTSTTINAIQKSRCMSMNMIYAKASILLILLSSFLSTEFLMSTSSKWILMKDGLPTFSDLIISLHSLLMVVKISETKLSHKIYRNTGEQKTYLKCWSDLKPRSIELP